MKKHKEIFSQVICFFVIILTLFLHFRIVKIYAQTNPDRCPSESGYTYPFQANAYCDSLKHGAYSNSACSSCICPDGTPMGGDHCGALTTSTNTGPRPIGSEGCTINAPACLYSSSVQGDTCGNLISAQVCDSGCNTTTGYCNRSATPTASPTGPSVSCTGDNSFSCTNNIIEERNSCGNIVYSENCDSTNGICDPGNGCLRQVSCYYGPGAYGFTACVTCSDGKTATDGSYCPESKGNPQDLTRIDGSLADCTTVFAGETSTCTNDVCGEGRGYSGTTCENTPDTKTCCEGYILGAVPPKNTSLGQNKTCTPGETAALDCTDDKTQMIQHIYDANCNPNIIKLSSCSDVHPGSHCEKNNGSLFCQGGDPVSQGVQNSNCPAQGTINTERSCSKDTNGAVGVKTVIYAADGNCGNNTSSDFAKCTDVPDLCTQLSCNTTTAISSPNTPVSTSNSNGCPTSLPNLCSDGLCRASCAVSGTGTAGGAGAPGSATVPPQNGTSTAQPAHQPTGPVCGKNADASDKHCEDTEICYKDQAGNPSYCAPAQSVGAYCDVYNGLGQDSECSQKTAGSISSSQKIACNPVSHSCSVMQKDPKSATGSSAPGTNTNCTSQGIDCTQGGQVQGYCFVDQTNVSTQYCRLLGQTDLGQQCKNGNECTSGKCDKFAANPNFTVCVNATANAPTAAGVKACDQITDVNECFQHNDRCEWKDTKCQVKGNTVPAGSSPQTGAGTTGITPASGGSGNPIETSCKVDGDCQSGLQCKSQHDGWPLACCPKDQNQGWGFKSPGVPGCAPIATTSSGVSSGTQPTQTSATAPQSTTTAAACTSPYLNPDIAGVADNQCTCNDQAHTLCYDACNHDLTCTANLTKKAQSAVTQKTGNPDKSACKVPADCQSNNCSSQRPDLSNWPMACCPTGQGWGFKADGSVDCAPIQSSPNTGTGTAGNTGGSSTTTGSSTATSSGGTTTTGYACTDSTTCQSPNVCTTNSYSQKACCPEGQVYGGIDSSTNKPYCVTSSSGVGLGGGGGQQVTPCTGTPDCSIEANRLTCAACANNSTAQQTSCDDGAYGRYPLNGDLCFGKQQDPSERWYYHYCPGKTDPKDAVKAYCGDGQKCVPASQSGRDRDYCMTDQTSGGGVVNGGLQYQNAPTQANQVTSTQQACTAPNGQYSYRCISPDQYEVTIWNQTSCAYENPQSSNCPSDRPKCVDVGGQGYCQ